MMKLPPLMIKSIVRIVGIIMFCFLLNPTDATAQGPPLTTDKPIMLAEGNALIKTLTEIRRTTQGTFTRIPLMVHYLPSSKLLFSVHVPMISHRFRDFYDIEPGTALGDIQVMGKYQFYRRDRTRRTFRVALKTLQTLPTSKTPFIDDFSTGSYEGYYGIVSGYETIKYGISNEVGYSSSSIASDNEFHYKFGFGLPLLKPVYPVNQINLYFEYHNLWYVNRGEFLMLYSQGVQYAIKRLTVEAGVQFPLIQLVDFTPERKYSLYLGTRFLF